MSSRTLWIARAWLAYLLIGVLWITVGSALGEPAGVGLISIGMVCLSFGVYGAGRRLAHGHRLDDPRRRCG
ncbi:MAG: hypothetical protein L0H25_06635 [Micrococcales bacterium]|nr:hypothetical protein [Micrococcales bacterium]